MYLAKRINGVIDLVEVEGGVEVTRKKKKRTEAELYQEGYKKACLTPRAQDTDTEKWSEYPTCFVQEWKPAPQEEQPADEISAEEALEIIMGG